MADAGTVERDGFTLEWVREGRGLPMMVLGARHFYPRYFPQSLREHFEIVFCDLRRFTAATPDGFDINTITRDTFSEDVEAVRRATGLDRPLVVGQSVHGAMALEYARHSPDRVRGVVAVAPMPPAGSRDGSEPEADFFRRDAGAERLAAHQRNLATRRVPTSIETSQDFIDDYVVYDAQGWYDYDFDCSALWDGVEVNLPVIDHVWQPSVFGGYQIEALDLPVFSRSVATTTRCRSTCGTSRRSVSRTFTTSCTRRADTIRPTKSRPSSPPISSSGPAVCEGHLPARRRRIRSIRQGEPSRTGVSGDVWSLVRWSTKPRRQ